MIKIGVCAGPDKLEAAYRAGFDYLEISMAGLQAMSKEEYQALLARAGKSALPVRACNCLLPGNLKVTGPERDDKALIRYLKTAFERAQALGVRTAVFGSGGARSVPEGFAFSDAWRQIQSFLVLACEIADQRGISIAIEPLRRQECNILNLVSEGTAMASLYKHARLGVLGDTFHMISSSEPYAALIHAGTLLLHMHVSAPLEDLSGRVFPHEGDGQDYEALFALLLSAGYVGRVSVEASCRDFDREGAQAARILKEAARRAQDRKHNG